jgi:PAS domain S-box-containing protein
MFVDQENVGESQCRSEEQFRLLVEGVRDFAIFMLDPEGRVVTWNLGAEQITGYTAREILGEAFSRFYPEEQIHRKWPNYLLEAAKSAGRIEDEGWRIRKDGSRFWGSVTITALYDDDGGLRGFAKVTRDLTERKRMEALEENTRRINEFLAMLAHELRNPLAPIRNAVSVMRMKPLKDPSLDWSTDVIERQVSHLARLVDDLLDMSRITSGRIRLRNEVLEVAVVVARALDASRPFIAERRHSLDVAMSDAPMRIKGDLARLSQALVNLLSNAARYTPEGGRIWVTTAKEGQDAVIRVRDSGIGLPGDLVNRVFDLFSQGKRGLDRSEGGLGIGLTLVRRLVEMHGGTVNAHSAGANRGSEFVVRLPCVDSEQQAAASRTEDIRAESSSRRRVLVVDDSRDAADSMRMLLQLWGHEARAVYDGQAAVSAAAEFSPDVVLLDIGLPGTNGYEVARQIRNLPTGSEAVLVAVTGYGQDVDRIRSHDAGMQHHLIKPVEPSDLERLLDALQTGHDRAESTHSAA